MHTQDNRILLVSGVRSREQRGLLVVGRGAVAILCPRDAG